MNPKIPYESNQRNVYFIDEFCRNAILRLPNAPVEFSLSSVIVSTTTLGDKCGLPRTTGFYGRNPRKRTTRLNFEEASLKLERINKLTGLCWLSRGRNWMNSLIQFENSSFA
ncbi:hypothetical protein CDAR_301691 [Caerostris darwini]|uniref:Uncharacterized protein n=1 Tax=Caerostris darwini TaxID=1538125 RepID=A0AAV4S6S9_9ARAC|nr:hypothetical protein CDAR_301691 [Caerostris darwini]